MKKFNAAIVMLSSRSKLVEKTLIEIYKNWNNKYDYPVYIFHFNNIYSKSFINRIHKNISKNIYFLPATYKVPNNLSEDEMYYSRKQIPYVKASFPKKRIGYLHMIRFKLNFLTNIINNEYPNIIKYEYILSIDDDSWLKKYIDYDLFENALINPLSTAYTYDEVTSRIKDTRLGLWDYYYNYIKVNKIIPKNIKLRKAFELNSEELMHKITWRGGNFDIYDMKFFRNNNNWESFARKFRESNGDYKYRWGDGEIVTLYCYTYFENINDMKLSEKGIFQHGYPTNLSSYAPFTKFTLNVNNFYIIRVYHNFKKIIKNWLSS